MADRQTRVLGGNGSSVQAFTLDPGLLQYVQSVFVQVDNSGGGDIQPTLTVQTNNGVAFAKKQQGRSIPAGGSGSATWALRLDDETVSSGGEGLQFDVGTYGPENVGDRLHVTTALETVFSLPIGANFFIDRPDSTSQHLFQVDSLTGAVYWYQAGGDWFNYTEGGEVFLYTDSGDVSLNTAGGDYRFDTTAPGGPPDGLFRADAGKVVVNASDDILVKSTGGAVSLTSTAGGVQINAATSVEIHVGAGQTFTVFDSGGNPKIQWTEGTLDLHIPTGGTIVADL